MNRETLRRVGTLFRQRPGVAIAMGALLAFIVWMMFPTSEPTQPTTPTTTAPGTTPPRLLSPEVQLHGEVQRLREDYGNLLKRLEDIQKMIEGQRRSPEARPPEARPTFPEVPRVPPAPPRSETIPLPPLSTPAVPTPATPVPPAAPAPAPPRLTHFKTAEVEKPPPKLAVAPASPERWVHLPAGSFLSATMLSGVYAPVRGSQPLPVLLHFDEAALGPNRTRVPIERCVAVAKAVGDYVSSRAVIQLDTMSCTLPNGRVFTTPLTGWANGADGVLGIPGEVREHTGSFLAKTALSAFIGGGAAGLAQAQATITTTPLGGSQTVITGSAPQFAALQGLAATAERMARFFERQIETLVPVIVVPAGSRGAVVIQNGVTIEGLPVTHIAGESPWRTLDRN